MPETNPNVLSAELDFVSTPLTMKYSAGSSDAIKNIQAKCADDYMTKCLVSNGSPGAEMFINQMDAVFTKVMFPRRLTVDELINTPLLSFKKQVNQVNDATSLIFKKSPVIPENSMVRQSVADQKKMIEHRTNVIEQHEKKFKIQIETVRHLRGTTLPVSLLIYHLHIFTLCLSYV